LFDTHDGTHGVSQARAAADFGGSCCRYELGRQPANTKLSSHVAVRKVRVRGGNSKFRALRLDHGNYSWGTEVSSSSSLAVAAATNRSNSLQQPMSEPQVQISRLGAVDGAAMTAWLQAAVTKSRLRAAGRLARMPAAGAAGRMYAASSALQLGQTYTATLAAKLMASSDGRHASQLEHVCCQRSSAGRSMFS
jgi:hypothetical protein